MIIEYSINALKEVYISGNQEELSKIAQLFSAGEGTMTCDMEVISSTYEQTAKELIIKSVSKKLVNFGITSNNEILVEGEPAMLSVIAENINNFLEYIDTESHIHIDYFDEHPYLDLESMPVIIGIS
jgi:Na+-translocating ferredoxin:NAD+ oxidoreductase RnfC subunit